MSDSGGHRVHTAAVCLGHLASGHRSTEVSSTCLNLGPLLEVQCLLTDIFLGLVTAA